MYSSKIFSLAFRVKTRQLHLQSGSCTCRLLSSSNTAHGRYKYKPAANNVGKISNIKNPGLGNRLKMLKQDVPDIESAPLHEEDIEELEGDFHSEEQMQEYFARKATNLQRKDEFKIIERKHFKPAVEPNMLTWSDKEQIRFLHRQNPQEWNIDRLAESFPATPEIIKKILKSSWKPESNDRVRKHDEKVVSNWQKFKEGKLEISCPLLKEHLKKFSERSLPLKYDELKLFDNELPKPQGSEFVSIIQNYRLLNNPNKNKEINDRKDVDDADLTNGRPVIGILNKYDGSERTNVPEVINHHTISHAPSGSSSADCLPIKVSKNKNYTLDELRKNMKKVSAKNDIKDINIEDQILLKGGLPSSPSVQLQKSSIETMKISDQHDYNSNKIISKNDTERTVVPDPASNFNQGLSNNYNLSAAKIPMRIHIPKSKYKVGYLYKVRDCFYSHDGHFLYRVPGVASENS